MQRDNSNRQAIRVRLFLEAVACLEVDIYAVKVGTQRIIIRYDLACTRRWDSKRSQSTLPFEQTRIRLLSRINAYQDKTVKYATRTFGFLHHVKRRQHT